MTNLDYIRHWDKRLFTISYDDICKIESVKEKFTWNDMLDKNVINPCDYCSAINEFPLCDDGATSSACNHCMYNIYLHMNFEIKEG